jgi:hypothetical protein
MLPWPIWCDAQSPTTVVAAVDVVARVISLKLSGSPGYARGSVAWR